MTVYMFQKAQRQINYVDRDQLLPYTQVNIKFGNEWKIKLLDY